MSEKGAKLVAISPQTKDINRELIKKHRLNFEIFHDEQNAYARKLDLVHGFSDELKKTYLELGLDLADANGESSWELPLATRIVVGRDHKILSIEYDADYKFRPEPEDVLEFI